MGRYSSYWLYQRYEKRGDQDWIPSTPNTYSISGDSENPMPLVVRIERDADCGYVCDEIERWVEIPISEDYVCDDCEVGNQHRWVQCNPSAYTYYGDYKYDILCEEVSNDGGQTWSATTNTKISSASTGVSDKKVKVLMYNGDEFGSSCGSDDGVWRSFPTSTEAMWSLTAPQHTTNVLHNARGEFFVGGGIVNAKRVTFSDCVFEIGDRYRGYATFNTDVAESGQPLSGVNHSFYCNWGAEEIIFPNTLKWIGGGGIFSGNTIQTLTLPSSVESIGYVRAWDYDGKTVSIDLAWSSTFAYNKRLINVNLNEGLKSIGSHVFDGCTALEKIEIPSTVEKMGIKVFDGCSNLKQIIFKGATPPSSMCEPNSHFTFDCNAYFSANTDTIVYVPCGSKSAYTEWIYDLPDEKIVEYGGACPSVPSLDTYRTVATYRIGNTTHNVHEGLSGDTTPYTADTSTFDNWTYMFGIADEITLKKYISPNSWISIDGGKKLTIESDAGLYAVSTNAEEIEIRNSATYNISFGYYNNGDNSGIGTQVVNGGKYIKSVTIASGCTPDLIGCFNSCPELTAVTINGCPTLSYNTFAECPSLRDVYINYTGGLLPTVQSPTQPLKYPFYNTNATLHVPCELYGAYKSHPIFGKQNIVRDSAGCEESYFRITSNTFDTGCYIGVVSFAGDPIYCGGEEEMVIETKYIRSITFENLICGRAGRVSYLSFYVDNNLEYEHLCSAGVNDSAAGVVEQYTLSIPDDGNEHIVRIVGHGGYTGYRLNYFTILSYT